MRVYLFKTSLEFQQYIINKVHFNLSLLKLPMNSIQCKVRRYYTTLILWIILSLSSYNCLQTFGIQEICKNKLRLYNLLLLLYVENFAFLHRKQNRDVYKKCLNCNFSTYTDAFLFDYLHKQTCFCFSKVKNTEIKQGLSMYIILYRIFFVCILWNFS